MSQRASFLLTMLLAGSAAATSLPEGGRELTEAELAGRFAKGFDIEHHEPRRMAFTFSELGGDRVRVDGNGDLAIVPHGYSPAPRSAAISLSDSAQQNLRALTNINAANALVQVLVNLNISIGSKIDTVNQGNFASAGLP